MALENNQSKNNANSGERHTIPMTSIISSIRGILTEGETPPERTQTNFDPIEELKKSAQVNGEVDLMDLAAFATPTAAPNVIDDAPLILDGSDNNGHDNPQDELILGDIDEGDDEVVDLAGENNDNDIIMGSEPSDETVTPNEPVPEPEPKPVPEQTAEPMPEPEPAAMVEAIMQPTAETLATSSHDNMGDNLGENMAENIGENAVGASSNPDLTKNNLPDPLQQISPQNDADGDDITSILDNVPNVSTASPAVAGEPRPRFVIKTAAARTPTRDVPASSAFPTNETTPMADNQPANPVMNQVARKPLVELNQTISLHEMRNNNGDNAEKNIQPLHDIPKQITLTRARPTMIQESPAMPENETSTNHQTANQAHINHHHSANPVNDESILNNQTINETDQGFAQLQEVMKKHQQPAPAVQPTHLPIGNGAVTLEQMVRESIKPMLSGWINDNLPNMVRDIISSEIQKITKKYQ